jgi:hypothetical protein
MFPSLNQFKPCDLPTLLSSLQPIATLLDTLADVVFFIKDSEARYVFVNQTLARRCGFKHREQLLGLTADQVFPERFGPLYTAQDQRVLSTGRELADQLEMHLYFGNQPVWCLTHKLALRDEQGRIVGLAGISRDLQLPQSNHPAFQKLAAVDAHIRRHFARPVSLAELTAIAGFSVGKGCIMAIVKCKPTSPGRRFVVKVVNQELHKGAPHAPLLEKKIEDWWS